MRFLLPFLLSLALAAFAAAQDTPVSRLTAFVDALNSKDEAKMRAMMDKHFAPSLFEKIKIDEWVGQLKQISDGLAPVVVGEKALDKPDKIVVEISAKAGQKLALRVDLAPESPHRIIGIRFGTSTAQLIEEPRQFDFSNYRNLGDLAEKVTRETKVPAIAIATWKDGKIESGVHGVREVGKPDVVTVKDRWLVGSIGKSMTATLIGRLIDQGKLNWDSKVGDLLKDVPMRDGYREITVEQLLQHRSGVPEDKYMDGVMVIRIVGKLKDPTAIRAAYVKDILNREPIGKPGEKYAYSNAGYAIVGYIAERLTGKSFADALRDEVFAPIGMKSAVAGMPGKDDLPSGKGQPHGHIPSKQGPKPFALNGPIVHMGAPAGLGIACNIEDLARYAAWHMRGLNGEKIELKPETVRRLHTPMAPNESFKYAAGWVIDDQLTSSTLHGHNGSDGTFFAEMAIWPKKKLVAVSIVNDGSEAFPSIPMQAILAIYQRLAR